MAQTQELERGTGGLATKPPLGIEATGVRVTARAKGNKEIVLLRDVSLSIRPGELVAVVGGSGAGKTTLLNALAGVYKPAAGRVLYNGDDLYEHLETYRPMLGYVPQDDIVHKELSVERTLHYAAKLRLPEMSAEEREEDIAEVIAALGLSSQSGLRVSSLSGGQRKRTSIGAELLSRPGVFFLDEPTSGLDPATGLEMMWLLRSLASSGSTVLLTTHATQDIRQCDSVVFLAKGGYLAFFGTPDEALRYFGVKTFEEIYERLVRERSPQEWAEDFEAHRRGLAVEQRLQDAASPDPGAHPAVRTNSLHQFLVLTERNFETLLRNRLTLAILVGAPVLIIAMFVVLFRSGAFEFESPTPSAVIQIMFWIAFAGFFFGLTYGLLQICTEIHIFHRERLVNLQIVPYVLSKMAVLVPVLLGVVVVMLVVLRVLDRLPSGGMDLYGPLGVTLMLDGLAAIALGLLASAAVTRPEQATLALPMLCFPQVLFSGAILSVPLMADVGEVISWFISDRWAFEALGKSLEVNELLGEGGSPLGPPLLAQYEDTFSNPLWESWLILAGFTVVFMVLTCVVLHRKSAALK